jgi:uncharacterized protein (DUF342 family)
MIYLGGDFMDNCQSEQIKVVFSEDRSEVYLSIKETSDDAERLRRSIEEQLKENGVVFGVFEEKIRRLSMERKSVSGLLIGSEQKAVDGTDGHVEFKVDVNHHAKPKISEDGRVDYKDMGYVEIVEKGQLLYTVIPGTEGIDGMSLFGQVIPAKQGNTPTIKHGKNIYLSEEGQSAYAALSGMVICDGDSMFVYDSIDIESDVGPETGNIQFNGDVVIKGNVLSGMTVSCRNLTVRGVVEDATIKTKENLTIDRGIQGHEHGSIVCQGELHCKYINSAKVHVMGDIYSDMILNSDILCDGDLHLEGRKGCLIGGKAVVKGNVSSKSIGSDLGVITEFYLGEGTAIVKEIQQLDIEVMELEQVLEKISQVLGVLDAKHKAMPNNPEFVKLKAEYTRNRFVTEGQISKKNQRRLKLNKDLVQSSFTQLQGDLIHVGTRVHIGNKIMELDTNLKNCTIKSVRDEIVIIDKYAS